MILQDNAKHYYKRIRNVKRLTCGFLCIYVQCTRTGSHFRCIIIFRVCANVFLIEHLFIYVYNNITRVVNFSRHIFQKKRVVEVYWQDLMVMISKNKFDEKNCSISIRFQYNNSILWYIIVVNIGSVRAYTYRSNKRRKNFLNIIITLRKRHSHIVINILLCIYAIKCHARQCFPLNIYVCGGTTDPYVSLVSSVIILPKLLNVHFFRLSILLSWCLHKMTVKYFFKST